MTDNETYSTEGPQCPKCKFTFTADEPHYFDEQGYTDETCPECDSKFKVEVHHSVSWCCELVPVATINLPKND